MHLFSCVLRWISLKCSTTNCCPVSWRVYRGRFVSVYRGRFVSVYRARFVSVYRGRFVSVYRERFVSVYCGKILISYDVPWKSPSLSMKPHARCIWRFLVTATDLLQTTEITNQSKGYKIAWFPSTYIAGTENEVSESLSGSSIIEASTCE